MLLLTYFITLSAHSQLTDTSFTTLTKLPSNYYQKIEKKASRLEDKIISKSDKALKQFSKQEQKLYHKLY
ncbi:MAG: hypothetical protein ACM3H8_15190 [Sphingobacteriales bacterium]